MRVLITGAAGFVGRAVVENLRPGYDMRLFDRVAASGAPDSIAGNIADLASVRRAMADVDLVVHLAMSTEGAKEDPAPTFSVNVCGTYNVVTAAREAGVRRIVHMSSGAVVTGYPADAAIHVGLPLRCSGIYPMTKCLQEVICQQEAEAHGLSIVCLRPWGIVDGRTNTGKDGNPLSPSGYYFGLICRHDVAGAVRCALEMPDLGYAVFHLMATPEGRARFDMDHTERVLGWRPACDFSHLRKSLP